MAQFGESETDEFELPDSEASKLVAKLAKYCAIAALLIAGSFAISGFSVSGERLPGSPPWGKLTSVVDPLCRGLWVEGARNDPALLCYISTDSGRLCRASERSHLAAVVKSYRSQRYRFEGSTFLSLLGFGAAGKSGMLPTDMLRMVQQTRDGMNGKRYTPAEIADFEKADRLMMERMVKAQKAFAKSPLARAMKVEVISDQVLSRHIEDLSRDGLMLKADYGWWPDNLTDGIWGYAEVAANCRKGG